MSALPVDKERIFNRAVELTDPAERAAFLERACGDDAPLRAEVEELLRHDRDAGSFLERPPDAFVATIASRTSVADDTHPQFAKSTATSPIGSQRSSRN